MLKIKPPSFYFCPFCGRKLKIKIEEGRQRKHCPSCQWTYYPHVGTAVVGIITKQGKALLVKRRREPYANTWMFPAGFVDYGEHPEETVKREVKEETGLEVKKAEFMEVLQSEDDPRSPGHFVFCYKITVSDGQLRTDEEENEEVAWKSIKDPPKIGFKLHQHIMKKLQRNKGFFKLVFGLFHLPK